MPFQLHTPDTAPESARETLETIEQRYGFVPNLAAIFAESPAAFRGLLGALEAFDDSALTLDPLERQVVQLAASAENGCDYCVAVHGMLANKLGLPREQLERIHRNASLADNRLEALRAFTTAIVRQRGWIDEEAIDRFLDAGYTRAQVFEVLLGIALKTLTNYASHLAHPEVNEPFRDFLPVARDGARPRRAAS